MLSVGTHVDVLQAQADGLSVNRLLNRKAE
jgi:hypothetical protein